MPQMNVIRQNTGTIGSSQQPSSSVIPADLKALVDYMQPTIEKFRDNSTPQTMMQDQKSLSIGSTANFRISSTGLGERLVHKVTGSISIQNTLGSAQAISLSKFFPFNIISNVNTQINGNTSVSQASPVAYVLEQARRNRLLALNPMNGKQCKVTAGANVTLTAATGASFSGYQSASIAASSTGVINFTFYFETPYVLNRETLIGILPLQNSSTFANVTYTAAPSMIGTDDSAPMYVSGGVPATTIYQPSNTTINIVTRYDFWTVPDDATLYQELIMNSFQIIEQPANVLNSTGSGALKFQFPLNSYLLAAMFLTRDSSNNLVQTENVYSNIQLQYNGNVSPFKTDVGIHQFEQFRVYANDFNLFGALLWDGTDTDDMPNVSDSAGWVDLYNTSNPSFIADVISASITLPATYSFIRVQIVPSDVKVIPA